jgi:hypothetical protein
MSRSTEVRARRGNAGTCVGFQIRGRNGSRLRIGLVGWMRPYVHNTLPRNPSERTNGRTDGRTVGRTVGLAPTTRRPGRPDDQTTRRPDGQTTRRPDQRSALKIIPTIFSSEDLSTSTTLAHPSPHANVCNTQGIRSRLHLRHHTPICCGSTSDQ